MGYNLDGIPIACYCRVSTKSESQQSSLENQQGFFYGFLERNPQYRLYKIYADEGISGKSTKRRVQFQQMIQDAKAGCFQKILVKDISRLARNVVDLLETVRELKKIGVTVEFITYNMETMGNSEFTLTILAAIAQEESYNTSLKCKFGKKQSQQKGEVPNCIYGYDAVGNKTYQLNINPYEAEVVKTIFHLYADKGYGPLKIARILNDNKIPTKRKSEHGWGSATIRRLLTNPIYIGKLCNGKTETKDFMTGSVIAVEKKDWVVIHRPELRIISDSIFEKAENLRNGRSVNASGEERQERYCPSVKHPLSNLIYCACGSSYRRKTKKNTDIVYWACTRRDKYTASACGNKTFVAEEQIHSAILQFFNDIILDQGRYAEKLKAGLQQTLKERSTGNLEKENLETEKRALMKRRSKLLELYLDGKMDRGLLEAEICPAEARIKEISNRLSSFLKNQNVETRTNDAFQLFLHKIQDNRQDWLNNMFLKSIFYRFTVYPDGKIMASLKMPADIHRQIEIPFAQIEGDFYCSRQ